MIELVRETFVMAALAQRPPYHGKTSGKFHVEVVGNCSLVHSQIEKL